MDEDFTQYLGGMKRELVGKMDTETHEGFAPVERRHLIFSKRRFQPTPRRSGACPKNTVTLESEYKQTRRELAERWERVEKLEIGEAA
jgi:hypothetical protein